MALLRCDFYAGVLELNTSMTVLLPDGPVPATGHPTLYLLHGLSDDDTAWVRHTSLPRYVLDRGLAVVMPQVHRSWYLDETDGGRYWTFLSAELPELVGSYFRLSDRREDTFVAGLSMGGYGAFRWALRQPHRFAAAASLSGSLDLNRVSQAPRDPAGPDPHMMRRSLGDRRVTGTDDDLFHLLERLDGAPPALYLCCGTEDRLYPDSVAFRDACAARGVPLTAEFGPGGHEWDYWDAQIQSILDWLPLTR